MNGRMKTKYVLAFYNSLLKIELKTLIKKHHFNFKYTYSLQKNLTCVLIYSLTKCVLQEGFKDNCSENFVILWNKANHQAKPLNFT